MSRIGKKPIAVPKTVTAAVEGQKVTVKGPKGQLSLTLVDDVEVLLEDGAIVIKPRATRSAPVPCGACRGRSSRTL